MLNSKQLTAIGLLLFTAIVACSSVTKSEMRHFFHTKILDDDSKRFTFTVILMQYNYAANQGNQPANKAEPERGKGPQGGKPNGGKNGAPDHGKPMNDPTSLSNISSSTQSNNNDKMYTLFQQLLEEQLHETKYCRRGYMELERSFSGAIFTLRGECHESATKRDRNKFL